MLTFDANELGNAKTAGFLQGAIGPRPICFASTMDAEGHVNLSPFSFFNVFSTHPPVLVFSPSRSGRTGQKKHTLLNVEEVPEVCINVVTHAMVMQASLASTEYARGVNEFEKAGFTALASVGIRPPRVAESPVQFECRVEQVITLGNEGGAGNLVLARVQHIHINDAVLTAEGRIDPHMLDLVGRMGGDWYTRANAGLFIVPKPLSTLGMGVDALPEAVRNSRILTGNDLGRLGNLEHMPTDEEIEAANALAPGLSPKDKHRLASDWIEQGRFAEALALVWQ